MTDEILPLPPPSAQAGRVEASDATAMIPPELRRDIVANIPPLRDRPLAPNHKAEAHVATIKPLTDGGQLTGEVKAYIVSRLAAYAMAREIKAELKEEFGIDVRENTIRRYDCAVGNARRARSPELVELFDKTRAETLEKLSDVAIARQDVRLLRLEKHWQDAATAGNIPLAIEILKQAAQETGGAFTNRQQVAHVGGLVIRQDPPPYLANLGRISADSAVLLQRAWDTAREVMAAQGVEDETGLRWLSFVPSDLLERVSTIMDAAYAANAVIDAKPLKEGES